MIVRDEHETLARCLDSVREAVDEMIIVDTGSKDATREIALRYTPHVYDFSWRDDFSAARNEAFAHATRDFLMWLDADDVVAVSYTHLDVYKRQPCRPARLPTYRCWSKAP